MKLLALPAFTDNYIWMLHDGLRALVVDPGDCAPVIAALDRLRLSLAAILVTHHHSDHVGGIEGLRARLQGPVYGPRLEAIPAPFVGLVGGQQAQALGLGFEVIDVPGHTRGHIAYHLQAPSGTTGSQAPLLFCGDTLFSAGCGRLFEGTPAQMHASLQRLSALPGNTRVCCAHEYTLSNLRFAQAVEPRNTAVTDYQGECERQRALGLPTLPSSIQREREVNPFLRCEQPEVAHSARTRGCASTDPVDVLATLRQWKNTF